MLLDRLEGRIDDEDFSMKADLETRVVLQRYLLNRLGAPIPPPMSSDD